MEMELKRRRGGGLSERVCVRERGQEIWHGSLNLISAMFEEVLVQEAYLTMITLPPLTSGCALLTQDGRRDGKPVSGSPARRVRASGAMLGEQCTNREQPGVHARSALLWYLPSLTSTEHGFLHRALSISA